MSLAGQAACLGRSLVKGHGGQGLRPSCEHSATWKSAFPSLGSVSNEEVRLEVSFYFSFLSFFFFWKKIYIEIVKVNAIIFEKNRTKQKFQSERLKSLSPPYPMGQPLTVFFPSQTFSPHRQACEYI